MCDAPAVSREHVPPQCFFPAGHRNNLSTVPSCDTHNSKNSKDVEYVRNIISTHTGTNKVAATVFENTKRSFDHSPKLMYRTFRKMRPVQVCGDETGAFRVDLPRIQTVMKAIAYALYFRDYAKKHRGDWRIFTPSFHYAPTLHEGQPDPWEGFRKYLESGGFNAMPVPQPEVFKYGVIQSGQNQLMFRFEFYEGFVVTAWTLFESFVSFGTTL
jgi:hypothetical protein